MTNVSVDVKFQLLPGLTVITFGTVTDPALRLKHNRPLNCKLYMKECEDSEAADGAKQSLKKQTKKNVRNQLHKGKLQQLLWRPSKK